MKKVFIFGFIGCFLFSNSIELISAIPQKIDEVRGFNLEIFEVNVPFEILEKESIFEPNFKKVFLKFNQEFTFNLPEFSVLLARPPTESRVLKYDKLPSVCRLFSNFFAHWKSHPDFDRCCSLKHLAKKEMRA